MKKDAKGFTLLEIIIVIIIVGVLASLALPRFVRVIEFSRSTEALSALASLRQGMERCYIMKSGSYVDCGFSYGPGINLDMDYPGDSPNSHFTYQAYKQVGDPTYFRLEARRNTRDGGDGFSLIWITQESGVITRSGSGVFAGIK